jgi:chromosome segregation ATPase
MKNSRILKNRRPHLLILLVSALGWLSAATAVMGSNSQEALSSWISAKELEVKLQDYMVQADDLRDSVGQGEIEAQEFVDKMEGLSLEVKELSEKLSEISSQGDDLLAEIMKRLSRNFERYQAYLLAVADYIGRGDYAQGERSLKLMNDIQSDEEIIAELEAKLYARLTGG